MIWHPTAQCHACPEVRCAHSRLPLDYASTLGAFAALSGKGSRMSPAASPRARRSSTQESEFAGLKFSALIGTGSFGRVYKGKPCGLYLAHHITRMLLSQPQHCRLACTDMCRLACGLNGWVQKLVSGGLHIT